MRLKMIKYMMGRGILPKTEKFKQMQLNAEDLSLNRQRSWQHQLPKELCKCLMS
jgi:hypothetical protein